jgi:hypothetical protein
MQDNETQQKQTIAVIGDGWAALGAAAWLAAEGHLVHWLAGTGARMVPPLPSLETGAGVQAWRLIADHLGVEVSAPQTGLWLREFRNKAFREPAWYRSPTPEMRREVREEVLWAPETRIAPAYEARFDRPLAEVEEALREKVLALPNVKRVTGIPLQAIRTGKEGGKHVVRGIQLGSGEEIACSRVIYADRWSELGGMEGLPKAMPFLRHREPMGTLQAILSHEQPIGAGLPECFYGALHKEAGEEFQRNVWGYFSADGLRSYWTIFIAPNEAEDNHEIAKKLRRMKQALDRIFSNPEWLPAGKADFAANIAGEQVRFEEGTVFAAGEAPAEAVRLASHPGIEFLTDGYGPSQAFRQVAECLGLELPPEEAPAEEAPTPAATDPAAEA